jgi:hypothetical protein
VVQGWRRAELDGLAGIDGLSRVAMLLAVVAGAAAGAAVAGRAHLADRDLPCRIWWREDPDGHKRLGFVSDRPGGPALPGAWFNGFHCEFDHAPSQIVHAASAAEPQPWNDRSRAWFHRSISTLRDGAEWWLLTSRDKGLVDVERALLGRWNVRWKKSVRNLEFRNDRTARGDDGSSWEWIAAEDGLELAEIGTGNVHYVYACVLDAERRTFAELGNPEFVGERIDDSR